MYYHPRPLRLEHISGRVWDFADANQYFARAPKQWPSCACACLSAGAPGSPCPLVHVHGDCSGRADYRLSDASGRALDPSSLPGYERLRAQRERSRRARKPRRRLHPGYRHLRHGPRQELRADASALDQEFEGRVPVRAKRHYKVRRYIGNFDLPPYSHKGGWKRSRRHQYKGQG